jgi:hypothetical protein
VVQNDGRACVCGRDRPDVVPVSGRPAAGDGGQFLAAQRLHQSAETRSADNRAGIWSADPIGKTAYTAELSGAMTGVRDWLHVGRAGQAG